MLEQSALRSRSICVVTPSKDRRGLIERLYESLTLQTDIDFTWVVVDDGGSDTTSLWLESESESSPFPIHVFVNSASLGKSASLNRAFDNFSAGFYLVVDSDDQLLPRAIATVRSKLQYVENDRTIGAIFFPYLAEDGHPIGLPPGGHDVVMYRSRMDGIHGKYDGCVGYTSDVTARYRYPEFVDESYVGPTVLQLLMEPHYKIFFANEAIGVAEYQTNGLTAAGRSLRLRNPLGMMAYSKLCSERGATLRMRWKYRISYWAYAHVVSRECSSDERPGPPDGKSWGRTMGRIVARRWLRAGSR